MSKNFDIIQLAIDEQKLKSAEPRLRNQVVGCMHARNELSVLNRLLLFSLNKTGQHEHHQSAEDVQQWCVLQVLTGKIVETWKMLEERILKAQPEDKALTGLSEPHKKSLAWLKDYFKPKDNVLTLVRDKAAFHYDKLNLEFAVAHHPKNEHTIYLSEHPANSVYYTGSTLVFRAVFDLIGKQAPGLENASFEERVHQGAQIALKDVEDANYHLQIVLYGLIEFLLEAMLGTPLATLEHTRIPIENAPDPNTVIIPTFIDIGT